ncbi:hypothetical protein GPECTOR_2g983 [Gonium pectorale]|uniref:RRM domain-containing protein n=1 Tax=Gonium pectorale TaxID=33097 RepID=A0A150H1X6_GONPE|nr:hypothetical protein GPECTOR_2g983 [Gonium pectorale]|eukprot:KXZ56101.1 hypothetical protein GPECTOR_2g983 [Gonium pectorale]
MGSTPLAKSVFVPPSIAEKSTTVYVGKIASTVPDTVVRTLLDACGRVKSWKRQVDPDTKQPKGFGFCEFEDAEGVLRAMRLLNGLKLDGSELLLKCNAATQKYTEQYEQQKTAQKAEKKAKAAAAKAAAGDAAAEATEREGTDGKEAGEAEPEEDEDAAADNRVLEAIMSVVSDREDKNRGSLPPPPPLPAGAAAGAAKAANDFLAQLAAPSSSGRSSQQAQSDRDAKDRDAKDRDREAREREREWAREADAERRKEEERRRELDAKYDSKLREWERYESRKALERRKRRLAEEEEDALDRQREVRDLERRAKRAAAAAAEASAHEGTPGPAGSVVCDAPAAAGVGPDVKPEPKAEPEVDTNDPIYQAMLAAARAPPPAAPPPAHHHVKSEEPHRAPGPHAHGTEHGHGHGHERHHRGHGHGHAGPQEEDRDGAYARAESPAAAGPGRSAGVASGSTSGAAPAPAGARMAFGAGTRGRNVAALAAMFGDEEETTQKRQLKPIRYSEDELMGVADGGEQAEAAPPPAATLQRPTPPADPKAALKAMMDSIPTSRDGVFSYQIKWSHYNASVMGEKFKGWVSSKVEQLLGVQEPTLVDYVVKLLGQHTGPPQLYGELSPVLDNDTETFVIKLYRMVIYETEKAALGLAQVH